MPYDNFIIISMITNRGLRNSSLFDPSSYHGISLPYHAIVEIAHIDNKICLSKQPLALFCTKYLWYMQTSFKLWSCIIVPCWTSFPMPIFMLHSDTGCGNCIFSKMTTFTPILHILHSCILVQKANFIHLWKKIYEESQKLLYRWS